MKSVDPNRLSFLVLDFNRRVELKQTLESIRRHAKIDHEIVVHANGGNQDYHVQYYNEGLIDRLILNKWNNGAGWGCTDLFRYCKTEYACYLEGDQPLIRDLEEVEVERWKKLFQNRRLQFVSLVGNATAGNFSQRAFFTQVDFYRELSYRMPHGGPGSGSDRDTDEHFVQNHILNWGLPLFQPPALVMDMGCYRVEEVKDGSVWLNRTDTRQVWLIKGPVKEKGNWPNLNEHEWLQLLDYQEWPDGAIPEKDKPHSFLYWKNVNDIEIVAELRNIYGDWRAENPLLRKG